MGLSVGWIRTCPLGNVFTRYSFGAMTLSSSMRCFMLATPDMNIRGGLGSVCWAGASSGVSSISELNRFVVGRDFPNQ